MPLKKQIEAELISAMKSKDEFATSVLRLIRAALKNKEIDIGHELNDDEVQSVIKTMVKQGKDAITDFQAGNREDLILKQEKEIQFLERYLPTQMSADELTEICRRAVAETGATSPSDMGKVMGAAMKLAAGRADGNQVREIVQKLLA